MTRDLSTAYTPSTMPLEHGLRFGFAPSQRARELDQVVAHVFHGARELADFLRAADRNRRREIAVTEPLGRIGQRADRAGDLLTEDDAGKHRERGEHDRRDEQALARDCRPTRRCRRDGSRASSSAIASPVEAKTGKLAAYRSEIVDARDRRATVGQARRMQPREVVDLLVLDEVAVVDQANRRCRRARSAICASLSSSSRATIQRGARSRRRSAPMRPARRSGAPSGTARKRSPCSAAVAAICCHGSATPACATQHARLRTRRRRRWCRCCRSGAGTGRCAEPRDRPAVAASVWRSATLFACVSASSPKRRRSSRAIAPASCTRDLPCWSARSRSEPIAEMEMPPTTSSTIATLIAAIHTPEARTRGVDLQSVDELPGVRSIGRMRSQHAASAQCLLISRAPFDERLDDERHDRQQRQQRGHGECADEVVLVVQDLDVQRHRGRQAADVAGHDRHGAELAHRARVAENHAVHQAPAHLRQRDVEERHQAAGAERDRGFLLVVAELLHQRNQLARHVREGHEHGRQHDARQREDDADVVLLQPQAEPALQRRTAARRPGPRSPATPRSAGRSA